MSTISGLNILYVWKSEYPWDIRIDKICSSLANAGANVVILAKYEGEDLQFEKFKNYSIYRVGLGKSKISTSPVPYNRFWYNSIFDTVKKFNIDLIIVREIMLAEQAGKIGKRLKIPVIMDMAENYPALMRLWKKYRSGFLNKLLYHKLGVAEWTESITVDLMDGIIVVCPEQVERLFEKFLFPREKVAVIYNTPPKDFVKNVNKNISCDKRIKFCHHGHLTDEKKITPFLNAMLKVPNHPERFTFCIAGAGESLEELLAIHKSAGAPDNIIFYGKYNYEELGEIISACDYGVLPYEPNDFNNYTIHNKIFDYFAYSKPVIVSNVRPLSKIADETNACKVVDFDNVESTRKLFDNIGDYDYNNLSQNAKSAFESKFNWEIDCQNLIKFINNFTKQK